MKIADFFVNIGVKGDTKKLDETIKKLESAKAQEKMRTQFKEKIVKLNKLISQATTEEQRTRLKNLKLAERDNYVNNFKLKKLKEQRAALVEQNAQWSGLVKGVTLFVTGVATAITVMDKLGNSVLKTNQLYTNFSKQTGISITNLNRMAGVAKLSGMNLPVEQVAGDLNSLQQRIFKLALTGEGSGIFAQLGMNPLGMNSDQFINALRSRFKGLNEVQKSYVLDNLGLSREWLNVLELGDKEYSEIVAQASKLQLSEDERKKLAEYTLMQQKSNMRFELAKQKLLIAAMPLMTKLVELASKIAEAFAESFDDKKLAVVRDFVALLGLAALHALNIKKHILGALGFIGAGLGIGAGAGVAKTAGKAAAGVGLKTVGKAAFGVSNPLGWLMLAWTAVDIFNLLKQWFTKDTEADTNEPPVDTQQWAYNQSVSSNMVNHFYNNPVPQQQITTELDLYYQRYLKDAKK